MMPEDLLDLRLFAILVVRRRCGLHTKRACSRNLGTNPTVRVVVRKTGTRSAQERMLEIIIIAREMKKRNV
jgi:hypothetical protein